MRIVATLIAQHPFYLTGSDQNMFIVIIPFALLVVRIHIGPLKSKRSMVGDLWKNCPYLRKEPDL